MSKSTDEIITTRPHNRLVIPNNNNNPLDHQNLSSSSAATVAFNTNDDDSTIRMATDSEHESHNSYVTDNSPGHHAVQLLSSTVEQSSILSRHLTMASSSLDNYSATHPAPMHQFHLADQITLNDALQCATQLPHRNTSTTTTDGNSIVDDDYRFTNYRYRSIPELLDDVLEIVEATTILLVTTTTATVGGTEDSLSLLLRQRRRSNAYRNRRNANDNASNSINNNSSNGRNSSRQQRRNPSQ